MKTTPYADRFRFLLALAVVATAVMWLGGCHTINGIGRDLMDVSDPYTKPRSGVTNERPHHDR